MEFYLVRHGETDWNQQGRIQGWLDVGLNEKGRVQARKVGERLPDRKFDVFTSPLRRASETSDEIVGTIDAGIREQIMEFRELNQGYWNGLRSEWVRENDRTRYETWLAEPHTRTPPGGESIKDVRNRVRKGLNDIATRAENSVLVVAHKVVNSLIIHLLGERPLSRVLDRLPDNAQIRSLTVSRDRFPLRP